MAKFKRTIDMKNGCIMSKAITGVAKIKRLAKKKRVIKRMKERKKNER